MDFHGHGIFFTFTFTLPSIHLSIRPSVCSSVHLSQTFLNCKRFSHHGPCPTFCDCLAVYPALFKCLFANSSLFVCPCVYHYFYRFIFSSFSVYYPWVRPSSIDYVISVHNELVQHCAHVVLVFSLYFIVYTV